MGFDQIRAELQEVHNDETLIFDLVDDINKIDFNLEYNELSHIRFRFYLHMPIFVSRQYLRHRMQSPNEMSGRYRTMPSEYFHLPEDVVGIFEKADDPDYNYLEPIEESWERLHQEVYGWYKERLKFLREREKAGVISNSDYKRAREVLRGVLGTSFFTDIVATWDLNNLIKFWKLRLDSHAQPEIQELARQMLSQVKESNTVNKILDNITF